MVPSSLRFNLADQKLQPCSFPFFSRSRLLIGMNPLLPSIRSKELAGTFRFPYVLLSLPDTSMGRLSLFDHFNKVFLPGIAAGSLAFPRSSWILSTVFVIAVTLA